MHSPQLLLLDEPTSNLDSEGKDKVYSILKKEAETSIIIITSNEESDLEFCSGLIRLEQFKNVNSSAKLKGDFNK
jgi:heme exporter protein A